MRVFVDGERQGDCFCRGPGCCGSQSGLDHCSGMRIGSAAPVSRPSSNEAFGPRGTCRNSAPGRRLILSSIIFATTHSGTTAPPTSSVTRTRTPALVRPRARATVGVLAPAATWSGDRATRTRAGSSRRADLLEDPGHLVGRVEAHLLLLDRGPAVYVVQRARAVGEEAPAAVEDHAERAAVVPDRGGRQLPLRGLGLLTFGRTFVWIFASRNASTSWVVIEARTVLALK